MLKEFLEKYGTRGLSLITNRLIERGNFSFEDAMLVAMVERMVSELTKALEEEAR